MDETLPTDAFDTAAARIRRSVVRGNGLPVADDRSSITNLFGANNPQAYIMQPDLLEAQGGMDLPPGVAINDAGYPFVIATGELIPVARRPNVLPVAKTPEGYKLAMPKVLDVVGNVAGNVGGKVGGAIAAKPGEMVLGSGMVKKAADDFTNEVYHGTSKPGFEKFQQPEAGQYMPDRALGVHVAKDPEVSGTFVKDTGAIYPLKIPDNKKFFEIEQPLLPYIEDVNTAKNPRNVISDQNAIESAIYKVAYKKDPDMFARFLEQRWNMKPEEAQEAATSILKGKPYQNGLVGRPDRPIKGLDDYVNYDGVVKAWNDADRAKAIEIFKKDLQDKGYEGVKYLNTSPMETANAKDPTSYIIFDTSKSAKSKYTDTFMSDTRPQVAAAVGRTLERTPNEQGFFSKLEHTVEDAKLTKGTPEQWMGYLKNNGVKSEELETVLKEMPQGVVTKEQLTDLVKANRVELKEKVLGGKVEEPKQKVFWQDAKGNQVNIDDDHSINHKNSAYREEVENAGAKWVDQNGKELTNEEASKIASEWKKHYEILDDKSGRATKYHGYQLPGGENYGETLLSFPEKLPKLPSFEEWYKLNYKNQNFNKISEEAKSLITKKYEKEKNTPVEIGYKAPHFDEHGTNLGIHIRHNDRFIPDEIKTNRLKELKQKDADGTISKNELTEMIQLERKKFTSSKSLHAEEWQSDLHQAGRDYGYKGELEKLQPKFDKIEQKIIDSGDEAIMSHPDLKETLAAAVEKKIITKEEAQEYARFVKVEAGNAQGKTVPDFPFKKNWEEVALKRLIHKAAKGDYDAISWTPGEAQALRYQNEIRQKIDSINWINQNNRNGDEIGRVVRIKTAAGGDLLLDVDKKGKITSGPSGFKGKSLDEALGKDFAKQILEKGEGNIDTKGYVMGAEGMKQAYDKRAVDIANAIGKKYGSKVEQKHIGDNPEQIKIKYDDFVNSMREEAKSHYHTGLNPGEKLTKEKMITAKKMGERLSKESDIFRLAKVLGKQSELSLMDSKLRNAEKGYQPIHYMQLTPELKKKALEEGFPLFSNTPVVNPVDFDPFQDKKKKYKITPVNYNPFGE